MMLETYDSIPLDRVTPASKIAISYLHGHADALPFYQFGPDDFSKAAKAIRENPRASREELCNALAELNASLGAGRETMTAIDRLRRDEVFAVVTGQQTAPLTGPYYTILKAMTAVYLCRRLKNRYGLESVAVFWAEGDDHDIREVSQAGIGYKELAVKELAMEWEQDGIPGPVGDLRPAVSWEEIERQVAGLLPSSEYRERLLMSVFEHKNPEMTLGEWFTSLMTSLFSSTGLIIAYSRHPKLRSLWKGPAMKVLKEGPLLMEEVRRATDDIRRAGFKPQIHKKTYACPFFIIKEGSRHPVKYSGDDYLVGTRKIPRRELDQAIANDVSMFSPGVVTRPVLQDYLLPTIAYVGGLSEISYLGQLRGVYRKLEVCMPVAFPRFSMTFVEPAQARILEKYSLKPSRFLIDSHEKIFSELISSQEMAVNSETWAGLTARTLAPLTEYGRTLPSDLEPMQRHVGKVAGQMAHIIKGVQEKIARAVRLREKETGSQIKRTGFSIYPDRHLVERRMSIYYYLSKYGPELLDELLSKIPDDLLNHYFLVVEGGKS